MFNYDEWDYICSALRKLGCDQEAMAIQRKRMSKSYYAQQEKQLMKEEILKELRSEVKISVDKTALKALKDVQDEIFKF